MSQFQEELNQLESQRCPTCNGTGQCDDAEPGDISFRTWTCEDCGGNGKKQIALGTDAIGTLYKRDLDADALRDGKIKRKETDIPTWTCSYCDIPNTAERKACFACGHRRAQ